MTQISAYFGVSVDALLGLVPLEQVYKSSNSGKADHWDDEKTDREIEENIIYFMNHGMSRKEAEDYCRQQNGIVKYLKKHKEEVSLTKAGGIMISYGWK